MAEFIECTSLSISFNVMGLATITYAIVSETSSPEIKTEFSLGGQNFTGYVMSINLNSIPNTSWYETHVTLLTTTN
jgi:hypothetical protein